MKKTLRTLLMGLAALLAGNALTSCSNDDEFQVAPEGQKGYVEFSLSRGADTRIAYELTSDNGLKATWSEGDQVVVACGKGENRIVELFTLKEGAGTATATFAKEDSQLADKSGSAIIEYMPGITSETNPDDYTLDLSNQEGTLASLKDFDSFGYEATLNNGKIERAEPISFMSILHFPKAFDFGITAAKADLVFRGGFNGIGSETIEGDITVKDVSLTDGKLDADIYVAVFMFLADGTPTSLKVGNKNFALPEIKEAGKIYNFAESNLTDMNKEPLTLEPKSSDVIVTIYNPLGLVISYKMNDGVLRTNTDGDTSDIMISVSAGDKLQLFGDNARYAHSTGTSSYTNIQCSDDCYVYGNIMSLIDSEGYATKTELTEAYTFSCLFWNNTHIKNHDSKALMLPATTLVQYCYSRMFYGCSGLTAAPELPATNLAIACYHYMFYSCDKLTTAPELPATALANVCYNSMFVGCTSLTTAPELPATELVESCYFSMFFNCTSLKAVTCLATDISAVNCVGSWLSGVAAKGTFTKAAEMTNWTLGNSGIPSGWDVEDYKDPEDNG